MWLQNKKFILLGAIPLFWTLIIFRFSLQPATQSSALSGGIVAWLVSDILAPIFDDIPNLEHLVRKVAHFAEYFVLGMLASATALQIDYSNQKTDKISTKRYWLYALAYCVLVAATDEIIQRFVPGRSGQLSDVLLDSVGSFCGSVMIFLYSVRYNKKEHEIPL